MASETLKGIAEELADKVRHDALCQNPRQGCNQCQCRTKYATHLLARIKDAVAAESGVAQTTASSNRCPTAVKIADLCRDKALIIPVLQKALLGGPVALVGQPGAEYEALVKRVLGEDALKETGC